MAKQYAIIHDLLANRPVPGVVNREFVATDTKERFRDTGAAWERTGTLDHAGLSNLTTGDPHTQYQTRAEKGAAGGYAPLDSGLLIPRQYLPGVAITSRSIVASEAEQLALTGQEEGDVAIRTDQRRTYIRNAGTLGTMADWDELLTPTDQVTSVDGRSGAVTLSDLYVNEADHTKAAHDALGIDAATLDGIDSTGFAPAAHVGSRDGHPLATSTLDGFQSAAHRAKTERALDVETSQRVVYVSPTGSDTTGDGTSASRWQTIQYAVNQARAFMQQRNATSAYKIVCASGTYSNGPVTIPPNQFAAFTYGGQGGIWIVSESGQAADVVLSGINYSVFAYGSCTLEKLTLEADEIGIYVLGGTTVLAYVRDCVIRRKTVANGGNSAVLADGGRAVVHNCSGAAGQLFSYGLQARIGSVIAKTGTVPAGATAAEFVQYGGAIR